MKKVFGILLILALLAAAFYGGLRWGGARLETAPESTPAALAAPTLRVFDGALQWNDGGRWRTLDTLAALAAEDPIAEAREAGAAPDAPEEDGVLGLNRGQFTVGRAGQGGAGGGGGNSDGEDISWSGDYT